MLSSPILRSRIRALCLISIWVVLVVLVSLWTSREHASAAPDKGAITPDATMTVNSTSDVANGSDGLCTLREAITAANTNTASGAAAGECAAGSSSGSDTINFSVTGTINLTGALPDIASSMNINGPGSGQLTVQRNTGGDYRIFSVTGSPAGISGLTVANGKMPDGFFGNNGFPGGDGGGIMNTGSLTLTDVVITANQAGSGGPGFFFGSRGGQGAGLYNSGTLTMINCTVSGNIGGSGGFNQGSGGSGGIDNSGTLTMTGCAITGNNAGRGGDGTVARGGGSGGGGGGINNSGTLTMTDCAVTGNNAGRGGDGTVFGGGPGGPGGGISASGTLTLTNVNVSNNTAGDGGNGNFNGDGGHGGGIVLGSSSQLTLTNSTVSGNRTGTSLTNNTGSGGGIYNGGASVFATGTSINRNLTNGSGGGILNRGIATFTNSTISGNSPGFPGSGGGIQNENTSTSVLLTNCTVTANSSFGIVTTGGASARVRNTIIAGNGSAVTGDLTGNFTSQGHNLIGKADGSGGFTNGSNSDQVGTVASPLNPQLGALASNGGPTLTHALLSNSPALDAGDDCVTQAAHCGDANIPQLTTDQRGTVFNRLVDGPDADTTATVDIGAYETQITLTNLSDMSTNEDASVIIPFDVGDASTVTSVSATSSNPTLVPNDTAHLNLSLLGSTEIVTINPASNQNGTTNITVTVNRTGGGSENKTFLLTVNPINDAPSFTKGADQTINEAAGAQTVTNWATNVSAGAADESGQALTFQVTNNTNAALFSAAPAISATGTLTYTTVANASGSATITLVLVDNGGTANGGVDTSAAQTFTITVTPVNDAPSFIKGANQSVNNNVGPQTVNNWATSISPGPADESGQTVSFQVTGNTNPSLFAVTPAISSTGTLTYQPAANAGGTATITITLKDNGGTTNGGQDTSAPQTFNININPVGGSLKFNSDVTTTESSGSTTITVKRVGDLSRAVTVDYATSGDPGLPCSTAGGAASPKCDFTSALGTLTFAAGEDTKTVTVLISQDSYVEGPEDFTVSLSNQTGGSALTTTSTATITISDDMTEPPTNSNDDASNFVRQHYHDFLNREPDSSGLAFWTNEIASCGSDQACIDIKRINVSAAFYVSIEFQQTGYLVERIYKAAYGDGSGLSTLGGAHQLSVPIIRLNEFLPDTQKTGQGVVVNVGNWQQQLEDNKQAFLAEFVQRSRFTTAYPLSMTAAQFVDTLNTNAATAGVKPLSQSERDQLVNDLSTNVKTRAQVLRAVAEDPDLNSAEFNRAFVLMQYFGYLRRNPNDPQDTDYTGYDFWLTKLNQFNGNFVAAEMVKAFIVSGEYRQRFGP